MVKEMKDQIKMRNLPWTVKFVIQPEQHNIYDEFCKQVLSSQEGIVKDSLFSVSEHTGKINEIFL
jgi:hypothetical protein